MRHAGALCRDSSASCTPRIRGRCHTPLACCMSPQRQTCFQRGLSVQQEIPPLPTPCSQFAQACLDGSSCPHHLQNFAASRCLAFSSHSCRCHWSCSECLRWSCTCRMRRLTRCRVGCSSSCALGCLCVTLRTRSLHHVSSVHACRSRRTSCDCRSHFGTVAVWSRTCLTAAALCRPHMPIAVRRKYVSRCSVRMRASQCARMMKSIRQRRWSLGNAHLILIIPRAASMRAAGRSDWAYLVRRRDCGHFV